MLNICLLIYSILLKLFIFINRNSYCTVSSEKRLKWMHNMYNNSTEDLHMIATCNGRTTSSTSNLEPKFTLVVLVLLAVLMVLLALIIVFGNALVIVAFLVNKNLRHRSNYFFLNLAISDFLVGAFCIPLYIPYILTGKWIFGRILCKLWLVVDYLTCTASTFSIVLISYDQFLSVTKAVTYRIQQGTMSKTVAKMVAVWVFAFLLYGPAILIWEPVVGCSNVPDGECYVEFYYNWYFLLCASTFEFFTPCNSVAYFNMHIYWDIQKHKRNRLQSTVSISKQVSVPPTGNNVLMADHCSLKEEVTSPDLETEDSLYTTSRTQMQSLETDCSPQSRGYSITPDSDQSVALRVKTRSKLNRDTNIAKSLAIIVCVFPICWAPYSLLMIIRAACYEKCVYEFLYEITFWLLWFNSSVNPFLYPLCHVRFRKAFIKILCPKRFVVLPPAQSVSS
ncbi:histamine H4 receptor [Dermochelys coriacea]|uniref:histamine H4 receptor n=1 Tax=Dermochelys coriacea TaxID=27794 RepID=UPI0018E86148|nr:histamine H4 receptor [Dermochelys coriacea]